MKEDPEVKAFALAERAKGRSYRDIAEEITEVDPANPVSHTTVKRWCDAKKDVPGSTPGAVSTGAGVAAGDGERGRAQSGRPPGIAAASTERRSALETVRSVIEEVDRQIQENKAIGDRRGLQAAAGTLSRLAPVLARLEALEAGGDDGVHKFTEEQINETMAALEEKFRAICARPLLCAECSRELSVQWGLEGGADPSLLESDQQGEAKA